MEKKTLSIIIPVYNAEKYVDKLLKNFMVQNLEKVEIILIDDGSQDDSFKICSEYAKKRESITVFHQKNQGASAARNKGIQLAKGDYIVFVDSDDSVSEDYVENVCCICEKEQADLIQFDSYIKKADEIKIRKLNLEEGYTRLEDYYVHVLNQEVNEPWDKAYKTEIIHKHGICFDTNMTIGEDVSLTLDFLKYTRMVYVHHSANYYYARNERGICANAKLKHLDDMELLCRNMKNFVLQMNMQEQLECIVDSAMLKGVFRTVGLIKNYGERKENILTKMYTLRNIEELLQKKYAEKSVEIRKVLLRMKVYLIISWMVVVKNKG